MPKSKGKIMGARDDPEMVLELRNKNVHLSHMHTLFAKSFLEVLVHKVHIHPT